MYIMIILVVFESRRGRARDAADAISDVAASSGIATLITSIDDDVMPKVVASADAVIAGCSTSGKVPFGDEPTQRLVDWVQGLPSLEGKPVGVFCTYKFFPNTFADMAARTGEIESAISRAFELKGGKVVASQSINFKSIEAGASTLVERVLEHLH
jgi:flavodoxin